MQFEVRSGLCKSAEESKLLPTRSNWFRKHQFLLRNNFTWGSAAFIFIIRAVVTVIGVAFPKQFHVDCAGTGWVDYFSWVWYTIPIIVLTIAARTIRTFHDNFNLCTEFLRYAWIVAISLISYILVTFLAKGLGAPWLVKYRLLVLVFTGQAFIAVGAVIPLLDQRKLQRFFVRVPIVLNPSGG